MKLETSFAARADAMQASEIRELLKVLERPEIISFAGGIPDPTLFPLDKFNAAFEKILSGELAAASLQYSLSEGYQPLREWLVSEMRKLGVECDEDNIFISSGSQQALDYIGKLFISEGDHILVSKPTYLGALQAFRAYQPTFNALELDIEVMPHLQHSPKLIYSSVDFANPTGESLSLASRQIALKLALEHDSVLVEDAAYQALRYDGDPIAPVLALELEQVGDINEARTIYCGSFSKTLSPGLRVGWVCAAKHIIEKLVLIKQASDLHSPTLNQMAVYEAVQNGFAQHVGNLKSVYRRKRDAMLSALDEFMPDWVTWTKPQGGMFIWLDLPVEIDAGKLLKYALERDKVAFVPGQAFHFDGSGKNTLRLNFSHPGEEDIRKGIEKLSQSIRALS